MKNKTQTIVTYNPGWIPFLLGFILYFSPLSANAENFKIRHQKEEKSLQEILSLYIQQKSYSHSEFQAGEWLRKLCLENGLFVTQMGNKDGNYNFTASLYPLEKKLPNIVLLNHIDIVHEGDITKWEYPPFSGKITDLEVWGRGAFDNKGPAIMQLFSLIKIKQELEKNPHPPTQNISLLSVSCEETICEGGIRYVIEHFLDLLNPSVVIGEGATELGTLIGLNEETPVFGISVAHKRALWLQLDLTINSSGHGSVTPHQYASQQMTFALNRLLKKKRKSLYTNLNRSILKNLGKHKKGLTGLVLRHPILFKPLLTSQLRKEPELFSLFSNTMTLTQLANDSQSVNVIADHITAFLDCRLLPGESETEFIQQIRKHLKNDQIQIRIIESTPDSPVSSHHTDYFTHLENALKTNYPNSEAFPLLVPNHEDTGIFRRNGITSYCIFPVKLKQEYLECIHNPNERLPLAVLDKGMQTFYAFLANCLKL